MKPEPHINTISVIGTGNVGWHLARAFHHSGFRIRHVISRKMEGAREVAELVDAIPLTKLSEITDHPDLYLICVSDHAIPEVAAGFRDKRVKLAHTSGSTGMDVLKTASDQVGVLYPMQTFSRGNAMDYAEIPFLVEGSSDEMLRELEMIAGSLSGKVSAVDSEARRDIHVAAVFACNFTNHLHAIAAELLHKNGLDFEMLLPLVRETSEKLQKMDPRAAQTGPAARNDRETMLRHLEALRDRPEEQKLYELLSENILRYRKKNE